MKSISRYNLIRMDIERYRNVKKVFDKFKDIKKDLGLADNKLVNIEKIKNNLSEIELIQK